MRVIVVKLHHHVTFLYLGLDLDLGLDVSFGCLGQLVVSGKNFGESHLAIADLDVWARRDKKIDIIITW